jgi:hypothetical protein
MSQRFRAVHFAVALVGMLISLLAATYVAHLGGTQFPRTRPILMQRCC